MAIVHDLLYQTEYLSRIDFGQYILKITRLLLMSYNIRNSRINIEYRMSDITLDISRAIPCGLIVNEIVTNSMIHGFPDGRKGNILIEMNRQEDTGFILKISDNGVGLSASFDTGTIESIGLTLVDSLVLQLGGTWTISSNGGTEVVMVFPGNPA